MDLAELRIFKAVVEEGGITRAAERLHRVQSNVTTRIKQLEDDLGVQLFLREGKRLHLSPAGRTLLPYAERLLDLAEDARASVLDAAPRGVFRLGAMESTAAVRLPGPLADYHGRYPEVTIELRTGNPGQLAALILAGDLDAALVAEPIADGPFDKAAAFTEELVIVAPKDHGKIDGRHAPPKTALAFEPGCPHRKRLEDWYAAHDALPERIIEMSSYHTMLSCAVAGMGVSLLPKSVLATFPDADKLNLHPLPKDRRTAETVLIWRKGADSPRVAALRARLTEPATGT